MKFYGEMRVQGGGPLDGSRFDALAYALAEIEETDPAIEDVDLTSSLSQGWVTATMTITQENLELAVAKLIATMTARTPEALVAVKDFLRSAPHMEPRGMADYGANLLASVLSSAGK